MPRLSAFLVLIMAAVLAAEEAPEFARIGRPFLQQHCLACHSGDKPKAELSLDGFRNSAAVVRERKVWDSVLRMIAAGEMPPPDRPRPPLADVETFTSHVRAVFDYAVR